MKVAVLILAKGKCDTRSSYSNLQNIWHQAAYVKTMQLYQTIQNTTKTHHHKKGPAKHLAFKITK